MNQKRPLEKAIAAILVALFFGVALFLRIALPYDQVFAGEWIKFTGVDAYYYMRIVDNLVANFPHLFSFDPYMLWPSGTVIDIRPFFAYFLASVIWLVGLGAPTQQTIDVVAVYFPAVLGALTVVPVYFIGKALFNRWVGVIAAGLVAVLPGEFLGRSILGFTDSHIVEVFLSTVTMLLFLLAVKNAKENRENLADFGNWNWAAIAKAFTYSLLAGVFLGIYFLAWQGALLFVFIIFASVVALFIADHLRGNSTIYLCVVTTPLFGISLLVFLPVLQDKLTLIASFMAILVPIALAAVSYFLTQRGMKPAYYLAATLGLGLVGIAVVCVINPQLLRIMVGSFGIFTWPTTTTILEMQPLLLSAGDFTLSIAWGNFTTGFFLSLLALAFVSYSVIRRDEPSKGAFVIWSLIMLAAALSMRRFCYYFAVNVALLTAYISWLILEFSGFGKLQTHAFSESKITKLPKKRTKLKSRSGASAVNMTLGMIVIIILVFYPNIGPLPGGAKPAIDVATHPQFAPSDAWCESLSWLRDNTPEPFGSPDSYYELYEPPPLGERYDYPQTAYGVTAWWDYGYWLIRIGRRIPTSTPGTSHRGEAYIFAAQDEAAANKVLSHRWGSKYVIVDYATAMPLGGKFHAVAKLSGNSLDRFFDVYYQPRGARAYPVPVYYPEYYRTLLVRLYNFDGKQVAPRRCTVISFVDRTTREGKHYKEIAEVKSFSTYYEAQAYIASQDSANYRIVGFNPFVSPVPLEALEHYRLVYSSESSMALPDGSLIPEVKIFEHVE
ncbi:MAG TPA: oligosaccharyl transferase, archaeosortase A system-associated [Dehalococcoidia bacterium]|nr:oligosaccharyl transferase, archaeosortase A system-associated [Dehalococcoidia bacterium]